MRVLDLRLLDLANHRPSMDTYTSVYSPIMQGLIADARCNRVPTNSGRIPGIACIEMDEAV